MKRTRLTARERKLAIVKAALPLFARQGYAETTTRDLARAAGVSEPLLYKHFPSKEALYLEIQNFCCHENDPANRRLTEKVAELEPCASTLVYLVYYLARMQILGKPAGPIAWRTWQRLMLNSLLEDGVFVRVLYRNRFECFCSRIEACLDAAVKAGEAVAVPLAPGNRARFGHHLAAWMAAVRLPAKPPINYKVTTEQLLYQAVWFTLRGMGMTDKAINDYYKPQALALFFRS